MQFQAGVIPVTSDAKAKLLIDVLSLLQVLASVFA